MSGGVRQLGVVLRAKGDFPGHLLPGQGGGYQDAPGSMDQSSQLSSEQGLRGAEPELEEVEWGLVVRGVLASEA